MPKEKNATVANKEARQHKLQALLEYYDKKGIKPTYKKITADMYKQHKISYNTDMIYRDKTQLGTNDTFVQDLATHSYSKLIHDCFTRIDEAEAEAWKILKSKWTKSKTVTKQIPTDDGIMTVTEETVTEEQAEPLLGAIREIRECNVARVKLLGGDIIKASAYKWAVQRKNDMQTLSNQKQQIDELKELKE